jgi:hypothetical protein
MPSRRLGVRSLGLPGIAAALTLLLVLLGALAWFLPYLLRVQQPVAEVPTPPALFVLTEFAVPPHDQACMDGVTIVPNARLAQFKLRPATATPAGGPPVELLISAPGYRARAQVPGGYPGGSVTLPIDPPKRSVIGVACFVNRGSTPVALDGTTEPRTVARSATQIGGKSVVGDIALAFLDSRQRSLLHRLGEVFGHASNLTDRLVPVWLIWILAALVTLGVPIGTGAAFYAALRTEETAAQS